MERSDTLTLGILGTFLSLISPAQIPASRYPCACALPERCPASPDPFRGQKTATAPCNHDAAARIFLCVVGYRWLKLITSHAKERRLPVPARELDDVADGDFATTW